MKPETIIAWRARHRMTRAAAARALHTPVETLKGWEKGKRRIPGIAEFAMAAIDVMPELQYLAPAE